MPLARTRPCRECGTGLTIKRIRPFAVPLAGEGGLVERMPIIARDLQVVICPECDRGVDPTSRQTHKHLRT